jgi:hypothetical protein
MPSELAGPVDSSWDGEATEVPLLEFTVNRRGDLIDLRPVPRGQDRSRSVIHVPPRREREAKPRSRRTKRAGVSRDGPPRLAEDDEPPLAAAGGAA